jgi:hypothetical protein
MITNSEELCGAQRQIAELEAILEEMRLGESPESYRILCKSYVRRIRQIRREIDVYLGIASTKRAPVFLSP